MSRCIREEREHCCDDLVIAACGHRMEYARALASLELLRSRRTELAVAADDGPLVQRIRRVLGLSRRDGRLRWWRIPALLTAGFLILVGMDQLTAPTIYRATSKILVRRVVAHTSDPLLKPIETEGESDPFWLQTEVERITSSSVLEAAVQMAGLEKKFQGPEAKSGAAAAVEWLRPRLVVEARDHGNILSISYEADTAHEARQFARSWLTSYLSLRKDQFYGARDRLTDQSDRLRGEAVALRTDIIESERKLRAMEESEPSQIADFEMRLDDLKRKLAHIQDARSKLDAAREERDFYERIAGNSSKATLIDERVIPVKRGFFQRWLL